MASADKAWLKKSLKGALWGLMTGDAVAMPVHWFYNRETIDKEYPHLAKDTYPSQGYYAEPREIHSESMISGMTYTGSIDIIHDKRHFYNRDYSGAELTTDEHGNRLPDPPNKRAHYHQGLLKGENTLEPKLVRVMMRHVLKNKGQYDLEEYTRDFIEYMSSPPSKDTYLEIWVRRWFESYSKTKDATTAAAKQKDIWSIGSMGGWSMALPVLLMGLVEAAQGHTTADEALSRALSHQKRTHVSENVELAVKTSKILLETAVQAPLQGDELVKALDDFSSNIHRAKVRGDRLLEMYREHKGPGRIPKDEMYRLHTELLDEPWRPQDLLQEEDRNVVGKEICHACYTEHGLPANAYFLRKYAPEGKFMDAIASNARCGGDSTHRGAVLGFLMGAVLGDDAIPMEMKTGLAEYDSIDQEISQFVDMVVKA